MISNSAANQQANYERFNAAYNKSREILFKAVGKDEESGKEDEAAKREVMELYKKGIKQCEVALKVLTAQVPSRKIEEVAKHRKSVGKSLTLARERLKDLEEMFSVGTSKATRAAGTCRTPHSVPSSGFPLLSNKTNMAVRRKTRQDDPQGFTVGRTNLSKAVLLKGVDEKFGAPLLDEILDLTDVRISEVQGADAAKKALEEAVIFPALNPRLFSGLRQPAQGILLFGPPGNGKTMLARAVATECGSSVFLNVSAAVITSKWVGDSEKLIRALFQIARNGQPAIIFIDEIDSMLSERNEKETEVSRRVKTEFLVQMDGMNSSKTDRILVIGATNHPYELDTAILRRFQKRILIDIPDEKARAGLITSVLKKHKATYHLSEVQIREIAQRTQGYSNSDLVNLCKEAAMVPVRELSRNQLQKVKEDQIRPIMLNDFISALDAIKPSANFQLMKKLRQFAEESGQCS